MGSEDSGVIYSTFGLMLKNCKGLKKAGFNLPERRDIIQVCNSCTYFYQAYPDLLPQVLKNLGPKEEITVRRLFEKMYLEKESQGIGMPDPLNLGK